MLGIDEFMFHGWVMLSFGLLLLMPAPGRLPLCFLSAVSGWVVWYMLGIDEDIEMLRKRLSSRIPFWKGFLIVNSVVVIVVFVISVWWHLWGVL